MAVHLTPPMFMHRHLTWGVHDDTITDLTFSVTASTFKYAIGLRPRTAADHAIAEGIARGNWALLELIAREAQAEGGIIDTYNHNGWQVKHTIDDAAFRKLFERHRAQLVTRA
jgi:hypothetical protein